MEYPKIETLYNRHPEGHKVIPTELRMEEFGNVRRWFVTEKIDGTNIRVMWQDGKVTFGGRTDNASIPAKLVTKLQETFTPEKFLAAELPNCIIFGEGYGEKIQSVGGQYCKGVNFRAFDILIDKYWLEYENMREISVKVGFSCVPTYGTFSELPKTREDLSWMVEGTSVVAHLEHDNVLIPEGVVAKSYPMMFNKFHNRIMWKLKFKDF